MSQLIWCSLLQRKKKHCPLARTKPNTSKLYGRQISLLSLPYSFSLPIAWIKITKVDPIHKVSWYHCNFDVSLACNLTFACLLFAESSSSPWPSSPCILYIFSLWRQKKEVGISLYFKLNCPPNDQSKILSQKSDSQLGDQDEPKWSKMILRGHKLIIWVWNRKSRETKFCCTKPSLQMWFFFCEI